MFKALFGKNHTDKWIVTVKNGDMIRRCLQTGEAEYRDTINRCWVPFSGLKELERIRTQSLTQLLE